ncbi:hypothetical protein CN424_23335 [Bacillus cereus]|nr:hypothetical protein CN424_23335 [Bacillus cereus]
MKLRKILKEVHEEKDKICNTLNVEGSKFKIKRAYFDNLLNGSAFLNGKGVKLSKPLLDLWEHDPNIVKFMLAHELGHVIHGDNNLKIRKDKSVSKRVKNGVIFLSEMRANIVGSSSLNFTSSEMDRVQRFLHIENNRIFREGILRRIFNKLGWFKNIEFVYDDSSNEHLKYEFRRSYPTRKMISEYTNKYKLFNDQVKHELLDKFYEIIKEEVQTDKDKFKHEVLTTFSKYYNG